MKETCKISELTIDDSTPNEIKVTAPNGKELSIDDIYDFVIGDMTDYAKVEPTDETKVDVITVLGNVAAGITEGRALKAFELYKAKYGERILFTGGIPNHRNIEEFKKDPNFFKNNNMDVEKETLSESEVAYLRAARNVIDTNPDQADYFEYLQEMRKELNDFYDLPPEKILFEPISGTTEKNAQYSKYMFDHMREAENIDIQKMMLVTSCTHLKRASLTFEKVFDKDFSIIGCPSTADLEVDETLKELLHSPDFNEDIFKQELKRYITTDLKTTLYNEMVNYRNATNFGEIPDIDITYEAEHEYDDKQVEEVENKKISILEKIKNFFNSMFKKEPTKLLENGENASNSVMTTQSRKSFLDGLKVKDEEVYEPHQLTSGEKKEEKLLQEQEYEESSR